MFTVNIGSTTDDPHTLTKTISWLSQGEQIAQFNCIPTDDCDMLYPTLILGYDSNIMTCNYAKITDWGMYYFLNNKTLLTGGRMMITLAVDVLTTYDADIRNCPCCITRNENIGINWVPDDKLPYNTEITFSQPTQGQFSTPFTRSPDNPWILTVINDSDTVYPTP